MKVRRTLAEALAVLAFLSLVVLMGVGLFAPLLSILN